MTKFFKNLFRLILIKTPWFIILNYIKNFLPNYKSKNKSKIIEQQIYKNFSTIDQNHKWFCNNLNFLSSSFKDIISIKNILEIGSYEGRSAIFFLNNFIYSNIHCIDTWSGSDEHDNFDFSVIEKNFDSNTSRFQSNNRLKKFKMNSNEFFLSNSKKYDLIFVDGDHSSDQVKIDIENSWKVLNKGGYLILDDYMWWFYKDLKKNPSSSINNFIVDHISEISSLKIWHQIIIKKNI
jgi:hypothetical protein